MKVEINKGKSGFKKPSWLKIRLKTDRNYRYVKQIVRRGHLHTVCEEAICPNIYECWEQKSATFMILGDVCTRSCGFCNITTGRPAQVDLDEPRRTAEAIKQMGLKHCVITSVNRDELPDGGAQIWAETIQKVHKLNPSCSVEVLIPDFKNNEVALKKVFKARPDILSHNIETIPRLYPHIRPQAKYEWSLNILQKSKNSGLVTKTGFMVGLGEISDEIFKLLEDIAETGCDIIAIGQYLQPTQNHILVDRYVHPEEFLVYKNAAKEMGFEWVEVGPLVRSSYHSNKQAQFFRKNNRT